MKCLLSLEVRASFGLKFGKVHGQVNFSHSMGRGPVRHFQDALAISGLWTAMCLRVLGGIVHGLRELFGYLSLLDLRSLVFLRYSQTHHEHFETQHVTNCLFAALNHRYRLFLFFSWHRDALAPILACFLYWFSFPIRFLSCLVVFLRKYFCCEGGCLIERKYLCDSGCFWRV